MITYMTTNDVRKVTIMYRTIHIYNIYIYIFIIYYDLWRPGNLLLDALAISHQRLVEESMLWAASERGSLDLHTSNSLAASIASLLCTGLSSLCALVPFTCHILSLVLAAKEQLEDYTGNAILFASSELRGGLSRSSSLLADSDSFPMQQCRKQHHWTDSGLAQVQGYSALPQDVVQPSGSQWIFSHRKAGRLCLALLCIWPLAGE